MKRLLLRQDDRGLSEIISYVLLVVIAVGIAGGVYVFLKSYIPREQARCPDDIGVSIDQLSCTNGQINIEVNNRGLFSVDGMYVKIREKDRIFSELLNEGNLEFISEGELDPLQPGERLTKSYNYAGGLGDREIEIDPFVFINNEMVICNKAIVSKGVICSASGGDDN